MQVEKYFARINYKRKTDADFELLERLQQHHLLYIPFENLDIHWKIPIELKTDKIFDKIVNKKRGGFCYELNSLFYRLLVSIGFDAWMISAKVYNSSTNEFGREYDHLAIIVRLEGNIWLVDVGFGEFSFSPLMIVLNEIQTDKRGKFMITRQGENSLLVSKASEGEWMPEYMFALKNRSLSEFEEMCRYHQVSPESYFTRKRVCSILTSEGNQRITLSDKLIKFTDVKGTKEIQISDEAEFDRLLWKYFRINTKLLGHAL